MIQFIALNPKVTSETLGLIPFFLSRNNSASASEQFHANYGHGGGWQPMSDWTLNEDLTLTYKGDEEPPLTPYAKAMFNDELILIYPYAWVVIVQPDGSFEVSRMD